MFKMKQVFMDGEPGAAGGAGGEPPANTPPADPPQDPPAADWRLALSEDIRENPALKDFTDVNALAGSYINAKGMVGADKIVVPRNEAEFEEAWDKLGRPQDVSGYEYTFPENAQVDEQMNETFRGAAHKLGLSQMQYAGMQDFYWQMKQAELDATKAAEDQDYDEQSAALKSEWGDKYDHNVRVAGRVLDMIGSEEAIDAFEKSGLGNHPAIVKMFTNLGEKFLEEKDLVGVGEPGGQSPEEINAEIAELMAKPAFTDKFDPQHESIVKRVFGLRQKLFSGAA